jgi:hypothetical protein
MAAIVGRVAGSSTEPFFAHKHRAVELGTDLTEALPCPLLANGHTVRANTPHLLGKLIDTGVARKEVDAKPIALTGKDVDRLGADGAGGA